MPPVPPTADPPCGPTLDRIQTVLDGAAPPAALDADPHAPECAACRGRIADARVLLAALAVPPEPVAVPAYFLGDVLGAVRAERRARRRRVFAFGGLAVAAALAVAAVVFTRPVGEQEVVERTVPAPARPVRVSDELAKAGGALAESSRPFDEAVAAAPKAIERIAGALRPPAPAPMTDVVSPVAVSLAELPAAARTGLEPVTGTTAKAFNRLIRDVGMFTSARPKS